MRRQKSYQNDKATLYLVATPIGNLNEFSKRAIYILKEVSYIACEDTRVTKTLLDHYEIKARLLAYHNFNEKASSEGLIKLLDEGYDVALVSDAGYPLISDPGFSIVTKAIEKGINVLTVSGPSAGINALVASGLPSEHYLFYGFLKEKGTQAISELRSLSTFPYTIIFYEAPHRLRTTLRSMYEVFGDRKACIARELTKIHEEYIRGTLGEFLELEDLKGEMVIIVTGYIKEELTIDYSEVTVMVETLIEDGMSSKDAIRKVSSDIGISKNDLYRHYTELKRQREGER